MIYDTSHQLYQHLHICLCEDHYNPLGIVRSLGEAGITPIIVLCTQHPKLVNYSRYSKKVYKFESIEKGFQYIVNTYSGEPNKPFVYSGSDNVALILDSHYDEIKEKFYFFNGKGELARYLQKYDISVLAKECGCLVPNEELLKRGELPENLKYPIITKASTSTKGGDWKADSYICENENELVQIYDKIKSEDVLIQEYISKSNEYCIDGISINGGEDIFIPYGAKYFRFSPKSYGTYMYFEQVNDTDLLRKIEKIMKGAKYSGIFDAEFLIDKEGKTYFLEVNFRNSAWGYAYTYGGFNLVYMWAKSTLDNAIEYDKKRLLNKAFTAMAEFEDYQLCVKDNKVSFFSWYKDFKKAECKYIYNRKDPMPFWITILRRLMNKIIRIILHRFGKKWKGY